MSKYNYIVSYMLLRELCVSDVIAVRLQAVVLLMDHKSENTCSVDWRHQHRPQHSRFIAFRASESQPFITYNNINDMPMHWHWTMAKYLIKLYLPQRCYDDRFLVFKPRK